METPVLCCITAQETCLGILKRGKEMAERLGCPVRAVSVQPLHREAADRARDLIVLEGLTRESGIDIDVVYSDNPLLALAEYIEQAPPVHIFTGKQAEGGSFVMTLAERCRLPVSMVWGENVYNIAD